MDTGMDKMARLRESAQLCNVQQQLYVLQASHNYGAAAQTMWLNRAISTLWPVYNEAIAKMAIEQAKPQIDAALKGVSPHECCCTDMALYSGLPDLVMLL